MSETESTAIAIPAERAAQIELAARAIMDGTVDDSFRSDPEVASRMILERILNAETFEEAFAPQTLDSWRDMLEIPVRVTDLRFNRSGFTGQGSPIYAVVDLIRLDTGEAKTVTCGGRNVLAQLLTGLKFGWFGENGHAVSMSAKPTADGNTVLWLVPADHAVELAEAKAAAESTDAPF